MTHVVHLGTHHRVRHDYNLGLHLVRDELRKLGWAGSHVNVIYGSKTWEFYVPTEGSSSSWWKREQLWQLFKGDVSDETIFQTAVYTAPRFFGDFGGEDDGFDEVVLEPGCRRRHRSASSYLGDSLIFVRVPFVVPEHFPQRFADGIAPCFFTPIREWASERLGKAKATRTKRFYTMVLDRVKAFEDRFDGAIPEGEMQAVCDALGVRVVIDNLLADASCYLDCRPESSSQPRHTFRFINSRLDHVDLVSNPGASKHSFEVLVSDTNGKERIVVRDLGEPLAELRETGTPYLLKRKGDGAVMAVHTLTDVFVAEAEDGFKAACDCLHEAHPELCTFALDARGDPQLTAFVSEACHYNLCVDLHGPVDEEAKLSHIDMAKAYTAFKLCPHYEGFIGKVTDFRECQGMVADQPGIYKVDCFDFSEAHPKLRYYQERMGSWYPSAWTSAELRFLSAHGVRFDISGGSWGTRFDFDFPTEMLEKGEDGVRHYARWVGRCNSLRYTRSVYVPGSLDMAKSLKHQAEKSAFSATGLESFSKLEMRQLEVQERCDVLFIPPRSLDEQGEIRITYPKTSVWHMSHITAFIMAYQRVTTFMQLLRLDPTRVQRVVGDGIYTLEALGGPEAFLRSEVRVPPFCVKNDIKLGNAGCPAFTSSRLDVEALTGFGPARAYSGQHTAHVGPPGSGKSHTTFTDTGLVRVLVVTPSYRLGARHREAYGVDNAVVANAIDSDIPMRFERYQRYCNVIIFDEISQLTEEQKRKAMERYRFHKLLFVGDPGFQLGPVLGEPMSMADLEVFRYEQNHRIQDPILLDLVRWLRELIGMGRDANEIKGAFLERMRKEHPEHVLSVAAAQRMYNLEDSIICATNRGSDKVQGRVRMWTERLQGSFAPREKFLVTGNGGGFFNGDVVVCERAPEAKSSEVCHALTVHKVQGETVSAGKLFVDVYRMWEAQHLFTACSRAVALDQLFVVVEEKKGAEEDGLLTGRVYAIRSPNTFRVYIGSTMGSLQARLRKHKVDAEAFATGKRKYEVTSTQILKAGEASIELLEEVRCESREELLMREREWIQRTRWVVNKKLRRSEPDQIK